MSKFLAIALSALLVGIVAAPAGASHEVKIENCGLHNIRGVYISDVDSTSWGDNYLDEGDYISGTSTSTCYYRSWPSSEECEQDVRLTYASGHSDEWRPIDFCAHFVQATY